MAARRAGSDTSSGPISYLDDVPFKISDKFRCPPKVGLPIGFCLPDCKTLLSDTQYDFLLERRSVQWGEELAEMRAAQQRAQIQAEAIRVEADGAETAATLQDRVGPPCDGKLRPSEETDPPPPALNPVLAGLSHNAILTPMPAPSRGPVRHPSPPPPPHSLNLADFEREEDPFDKLELKTLDDKEELRNILQVQSATPPDTTSTPSSSSSLAKPGLFHKANGLVTLLDAEPPGTRVHVEAGRPCNIRSLTFPKLSDPGDASESEESHAPIVQHTLPNGGPQTTHRNISHTLNGPPKQADRPLPELQGTEVTHGGVLLSLSPGERECVETVVGMGYSYEGVLKAMQRQGQNVEQVLDYLFIYGRLCERGFEPSAVEECLEVYQCSEEKALEFLQLMSRFGEMGFERDAIKEVLLVHNNDQDKALEDLMARAAAS